MEVRKNILIILLIFTATAACYSSVLDAGFIWDDEFLVVENPLIRAPLLSFQPFKQDIINSGFRYTVYYRPLQIMSYAADYRLWGMSSSGFHFTNIFLHFLNGLLVLLLTWKLTREKVAGLLAGVFFVIHPALSGAVSYISGRTDLLFFFFGLLFLIFQILYFEKRRYSSLLAGTFFLILSLLSKEAALIFPVIALLMYLLIFKNRSEAKGIGLIPGFAAGAFYAAAHRVILGSKYAGLFDFKDFLGFLSRYAETVRESLFIILFPLGLHLRRVPVPQTGGMIALLSVMAIFIFVLIYLKDTRPVLSFGLWFFLAGLIPFAFVSGRFNVLGEHWVYLSSVGIFLFAGLAITRLYQRRGKVSRCILVGIVFIVVSSYSSMTIIQNRYWQSNITLSDRVLGFSGEDRLAVYYKATALSAGGKKVEALKIMDEYIEASGGDPVALYLKGRLAVADENIPVAESAFTRAVNIDPEYDDGYLGLAMVEFVQRKDEEGIGYLEKVLEINPGHTEALMMLGMAYTKAGNRIKAMETAQKAREKNPYNYDSIMTQGNIYLQIGNLHDAAKCYLEASKLYPERTEAYYRLGYVFLIGGEEKQAEKWLKKAVMVNPSFIPAQDLLKKIRSREK